MVATLPDLLRLFAVPFFGIVAWRDIRTRRVSNRTWYPLAALAIVLFAWEVVATLGGDVPAFQQRLFLIRVGVSLGIVIPLVYGFWLLGGFGGADAKAFFVVAVLFPTYPTYALGDLVAGLPTLPLVETTLGVFSLTILSNTVLVGLAYPIALATRNAGAGHLSPAMFVATPIRWDEATARYGSLIQFSDRALTADLSISGLRGYDAWRSLDLDALRMYLKWRGETLASLRDRPDHYRDPSTLPADPCDPGDGRIATDGGVTMTDESDPWGAAAFLADVEGDAYGTDPATLREGLDALVAEDVVWISPGIPFLVPLFGGLLVALTYGDVLFGLLRLLGWVSV